MRMRLSRRAVVEVTAVAMTIVGVPAFAGGHGGGGGGGGGNPGSQPYIQFKSGGYSVTEGTSNAVIQLQRVPKGVDQVYFSTNGSPNGALGATDCSDPASDYITQTNHLVGIGSNGVGTALVPICNNSFFENSETVNLILSAAGTTPVGGKITATLTINDNDKAPVLSVNNKTGAEGTTQTFTVTASTADPLLPMSVHWSTSDGTAKVADGDYASQSGDVAIAPGSTTATFDVASLDDGVFEPGTDEYFWVNLSAPVNSSISSTAGSGKYTVQDIDAPPTLSVDDVTDWEGNVIGFTVTRTGMTTGTATFDWTTSSDADASATANGDPNNVCGVNANDYVSAGAHNVSIAPGGATASTTVSVTTCDDTLPEDNEQFHVYLSSPAFATISDGTGVGTIRDNDPYAMTLDASPTSATAALPPDNINPNVTAVVTNTAGDPLNGQLVRYEVYRDTNSDFSYDQIDMTGPGGAAFAYTGSGAAAGGASIPVVDGQAVLGPANGGFIGYTNYAQPRTDVIIACVVPDFSTTCGSVVADGNADPFTNEDTTLGLPTTLPGNFAAVVWS